MTRLDTRPYPPSVRRALPKIGLYACLAAALVLMLVGLSLLSLPSVVPKLTVVNPGAYQVHVEVSGSGKDGWLDLGAVERESTKTLEELIDQGHTWLFRFSYGGVPAGETVVVRSALKRDGWRITVPAEVTERLRQTGMAPSAQ